MAEAERQDSTTCSYGKSQILRDTFIDTKIPTPYGAGIFSYLFP